MVERDVFRKPYKMMVKIKAMVSFESSLITSIQ
jgi:hypothetical protein